MGIYWVRRWRDREGRDRIGPDLGGQDLMRERIGGKEI